MFNQLIKEVTRKYKLDIIKLIVLFKTQKLDNRYSLSFNGGGGT